MSIIGNFTKIYTFKSSDNVLAFLMMRGVPNDKAVKWSKLKSGIDIIKEGNLFTIRRYRDIDEQSHDISFELDKEFDETRPNGQTVRSIVVAGGNDGNQLIKTQLGDNETKFVYDFNDNKLVITGTYTSNGLQAQWIYTSTKQLDN
ncbi:fatty acid-binding protein, brain-like [Oppia nitens]|uniref:fatty acid-binding protein, brain-like n=1 Tax=Oppia nitens TaxID=1686743 RepID=UPI0023DA1314|nr:fatty acid-binding protein, brain-like [Oppia nitens]